MKQLDGSAGSTGATTFVRAVAPCLPEITEGRGGAAADVAA